MGKIQSTESGKMVISFGIQWMYQMTYISCKIFKGYSIQRLDFQI